MLEITEQNYQRGRRKLAGDISEEGKLKMPNKQKILKTDVL